MRNFFPLANHNGQTVSSEDLLIPKKDKGVFTTIKVRDKIPLFFEKHLDRLIVSSKILSIKFDPERIKNALTDTIEKNKTAIYAVRITLLENNFMIHSFKIPVSKPIRLITIIDKRQNQSLKIIDRTINQAAFAEATSQGADDAVFINNSTISEAANSNIFSINENGQIITTPINGHALAGITRQIIMESIEIKEEKISVYTKNPLILTNCLRIQKAVSLNKNLLADGEKLLQKLQDVLEKKENEYLALYQ